MHPELENIIAHTRDIKLLVLDVDGVLTDGKLYYSNTGGDEMKTFCTLDGQGIRLLQVTQVKVALISGRQSKLVELRAKDLQIDIVYQGKAHKLKVLDQILEELGLTYADVAYVGDDLPDLACIRKAAMGITVPNGHFVVKQHADFITTLPGGEGAVREVCDWILQGQGNLDTVIEPFL